jgi:hypothetical protein
LLVSVEHSTMVVNYVDHCPGKETVARCSEQWPTRVRPTWRAPSPCLRDHRHVRPLTELVKLGQLREAAD